MTYSSALLISLAWFVLGYLFLDAGETAHSMFSSMASLMTVGFARKR
jgi:hypothetical protein